MADFWLNLEIWFDNIAESLHKGRSSDGLLTSKCLDCNETSEKKFDETYLRDSKTHISSMMEKFIFCNEVFIHI